MSFQQLEMQYTPIAPQVSLVKLGEDLMVLVPQDAALQLNANYLGGKGHSLVVMATAGLRVPKALIIPTVFGKVFSTMYPTSPRYREYEIILKHTIHSPLLEDFLEMKDSLFSVRSGAAISMAGMMDTILNVGSLGGDNGFRHKNYHRQDFVEDCQQRFLSMFAKACELPEDLSFTDFNAYYLFSPFADSDHVSRGSVQSQLRMCADLVFKSWNSDRAKYYRKMNNIPSDLGTAVIVQQMVYGNISEDSCTGVVFSRSPTTGEDVLTGEYLDKAQGEDVVSGSTTPKNIDELRVSKPELYSELLEGVKRLEDMKGDVQDVEFTVQDGTLYFLQTRDAKRTVEASIKIIKGMIKREDPVENAIRMLRNLDVNALASCSVPKLIKPPTPDHYGLGSCPGGISGIPCYNLTDILMYRPEGKTIYVALETTPDDIRCLDKADAILTLRGGATSHAAVVARAMNKPCVVGATSLTLDTVKNAKSSRIAIDGSTGGVWLSGQGFEEGDLTDVEDFLDWFFNKIGMPLIKDEVSDVDLLCNQLQNLTPCPQFYTRPREGSMHGDTVSDFMLYVYGDRGGFETVDNRLNYKGIIPLQGDGKTEGIKVQKVGSLVELISSEGPTVLTKAAEKTVDPEVLNALMGLRSKVYGVATQLKKGTYITRSKAFKALAILKNNI